MAALHFTEAQRTAALQLARHSLLAAFGRADEPSIPALLRAPGASFVTLEARGELRGCMGTLYARQSLGADIITNAKTAALADPRFPPVSLEELAQLELEVSLLTAPEPLAVTEEAALLAALRPGEDGLILEFGVHRATFLPSVWRQLPQPGAFVAQLKRKAGLPADFWSDGLNWWRYRAERVRGRLVEKSSGPS